MPQFIKLPVIHPNNIEGDTVVYLNPDEIAEIGEASAMDKRQRSEIRSMLFKKNGSGLATTLTCEEVIELISQVV